MTNILAFSLSTNNISISISKGAKLLATSNLSGSSHHAENINIMILEILEKANLSYQEIDFALTTSGPGNFTTIRIALALLYGLKVSSNIKTYVIPIFDLFAARAIEQVKNISKIKILLDARKSSCYYQEFDLINKINSKPKIIANKDLINLITKDAISNQNEQIIVAGNGIINIDDINIIENNQFDKISNLHILPRFQNINSKDLCKYFAHYILFKNENVQLSNKNYQKFLKMMNFSKKIKATYIREADAIAPNNFIKSLLE